VPVDGDSGGTQAPSGVHLQGVHGPALRGEARWCSAVS